MLYTKSRIFLSAMFALFSCILYAAYYGNNVYANVRYQRSYIKRNGTYVSSHYKTRRNHTNSDNFSTYGNYNPYNGNKGYRPKDYSAEANNYGKGHTIYKGNRGGQYYYNSRGNKVYIPKR